MNYRDGSFMVPRAFDVLLIGAGLLAFVAVAGLASLAGVPSFGDVLSRIVLVGVAAGGAIVFLRLSRDFSWRDEPLGGELFPATQAVESRGAGDRENTRAA